MEGGRKQRKKKTKLRSDLIQPLVSQMKKMLPERE